MSELHGNTSVSASDKKEHHKALSAKRITDVGSDDLIKIDESLSGTTYVGKADRGTNDTSEGWLLTRIVESGSVTVITHASDSWDNRASASYA